MEIAAPVAPIRVFAGTNAANSIAGHAPGGSSARL